VVEAREAHYRALEAAASSSEDGPELSFSQEQLFRDEAKAARRRGGFIGGVPSLISGGSAAQ
jgi:hypothetical protein